MSRLITNVIAVLPLSLATGFSTGGAAYAFVLGFAGIQTLSPKTSVLGDEIWLAFQYACIGVAASVFVAVLASFVAVAAGRELTRKQFLAVLGGIFVFALIFLPAELSFLMSHRPINPASKGFVLASGGFIAVSALGGWLSALVVSRYAETLGRLGGFRATAFGVALAALSGFVCGRLLLTPPSSPTDGETALVSTDGVAAGRNSGKVVIIGLDGATWRLIEPMMERGELPNLEWLTRHGTSAALTSLVPIESPRIWTSMATGKMPDKHGIDRFIVDRRFINTATLWEIADAAGKRVGLYEWLVTYPPQAIHGYVIPGWLAGGKSTTFPDSLGRSLFMVRSLRHPFWFFGIAGFRLPLGYLEQARGNPIPRTINSQFVKAEFKQLDVPYLRAVHDTDLFVVVFYGTDVLAHSLWQFMEPEHFPDADPVAVERYRDALPAYYRLVDRAIGTIREHYNNDTTFIVVSDHGFRRATVLDRVNYIAADALLSDMGASDVAQNVGGSKDHAIIALKPSLGFSESEGRALRRKIIGSLNAIESTEGKRVFLSQPAAEGEETIHISMHPEIDLGAEHWVRLGEESFPLNKYLQQAVLSGEHDLVGILIIQGPGVRRNHQLSDASVVDIAPTVLYTLGLPVGRDMDGEVLTDAFTEETLNAKAIQSIDSYDAHLEREAPPEHPDVDPELMKRLRA